MKINTSYLLLKTDRYISCDASKLRGYIGNQFIEYPILHNHYNKEKYHYGYPLIQYKVINGQAVILGINEGVEVLKDISSSIKKLKMDKYYSVNEKVFYEKEVNVSISRKEYQYQFMTPWIGLNTENYKKFIKIKNWKDKKIFLNKIIIGNILSMCKGLGIIVNRQLRVKSYLNEKTVQYKSVNMKGFTGEFTANFRMPTLFGLGKGVSQGFGTVKRIFDGE